MASDVVIDQNLKIPLLAHSNKLLKYASNDKDRKARFSDVALLSGKKVSYCLRQKRSISYIYRPQRSCEGYVFTGVCLSTG